jgi:hypothetical protein
MKIYKNKGIRFLLAVAIVGSVFVAVVSSCGKGGVKNATSMNIGYQVINLNHGLGPVSLYINYTIYNNYNFYYIQPSGYFNLTSIDTPFQIRSSPSQYTGLVLLQGNIFSIDSILKANTRYTLFITGLDTATRGTVFLTDTAPTPSKGRGKVRFLNCSPQSPGFDLVANNYLDTGFKNITYQHVSKYVEMPAGNYNFQVYQTGNSSLVLGALQNVTVQDGRLYTLYSYGVVGHTDSLAFGMSTIVNK